MRSDLNIYRHQWNQGRKQQIYQNVCQNYFKPFYFQFVLEQSSYRRLILTLVCITCLIVVMKVLSTSSMIGSNLRTQKTESPIIFVGGVIRSGKQLTYSIRLIKLSAISCPEADLFQSTIYQFDDNYLWMIVQKFTILLEESLVIHHQS